MAVYFKMLRWELTGQPYNKREQNRGLAPLLDGRKLAAIELKHMNISAILKEMNFPHIAGYKAYGNWQNLLKEVVLSHLQDRPEIDDLALECVERSAEPPDLSSLQGVKVDPPRVGRVSDSKKVRSLRIPFKRDYLAIEGRNRSLGTAGELFVADFEARRLHSGGHKLLAERVEHVANTRGDGLGYDVLSFDVSGRERFVEVKTTAFSIGTPFYVSQNELAFSDEAAEQFVLSRVFQFRQEPHLFELSGPIRRAVRLDAVTYLARF